MNPLLNELKDCICNGKTQDAMNITKQLLRQGINPEEIIGCAFRDAYTELNTKMIKGHAFVTDVLMASRSMHAVMYILQPLISNYSGSIRGMVVIGTVEGDLHDIGKNLVSMFLTGRGYAVLDLGIDVTKEAFVEAVEKYKADVLALSALLTTTMPEMKSVVDYLRELELRDSVRVIVGGGPVSYEYASQIGADAYASDLPDILEAVDDLINDRIGRFSVI